MGSRVVGAASYFRDMALVRIIRSIAPRHGRITTEVVDDEVQRLNAFWRRATDDDGTGTIIEDLLGAEAAARLDRFDAVQLATVLRTCREHATASSAGRALFAISRQEKKSSNDADRLTKYLARFGIRFEDVKQR